MKAILLISLIALASANPISFENFFPHQENNKPHNITEYATNVFECVEAFIRIAQNAYHVYEDVEQHQIDQAFNDLISTVESAEQTYNTCFNQHIDYFHPAAGANFTQCYTDLVEAKSELKGIVEGFKIRKFKSTFHKLEELALTVEALKEDCYDEYYEGESLQFKNPISGFKNSIQNCTNAGTKIILDINNVITEAKAWTNSTDPTPIIDDATNVLREVPDFLTQCGLASVADMYNKELPPICIDNLNAALDNGYFVYIYKDQPLKLIKYMPKFLAAWQAAQQNCPFLQQKEETI